MGKQSCVSETCGDSNVIGRRLFSRSAPMISRAPNANVVIVAAIGGWAARHVGDGAADLDDHHPPGAFDAQRLR